MSKINNSFHEFSRKFRNFSQKDPQEAYDKINNPVTKLDLFLKTSAFSQRTMNSSNPSEIKPQQIQHQQKPDYYFIEHYPRFTEDKNCNQKIFGQRQTPFQSEIFEEIKKKFNNNSYSFHYDSDKINYANDSGLPTLPSEKRQQLINIKNEQDQFKTLRQEVNFLNRKHRILENLHHSETYQYVKKRERNKSYDKYKNPNQNIEFLNTNSFIGDQMNSTFIINQDWKSRNKSNSFRQNTHERIISQEATIQRINQERLKQLKYQDSRGRDYKIISLIKEEY